MSPSRRPDPGTLFMPILSVKERFGTGRRPGAWLVVFAFGAACPQAVAGPVPAQPSGSEATIATPVAVFEADQRTVLDGNKLKLSAYIGTLSTGNGGPVCSAVCLGPDMIATASHCLYGTSAAKGPALGDITFATSAEPQQRANIAGGETAMQSQNIISGTTRLNVQPPIDAVNDWAIVRLAAPVCRSGGLALHEATAAEREGMSVEQPLYQVAMHRDLPDTDLRYDGPCALKRDFPQAGADLISRDFTRPDAILFHHCDTGPGSSGSPMLVDGDNGPEIAAINIGTYVISRSVVEARAGDAADKSTPIANTAIATRQFAAAVADLGARDLLSTPAEVLRLELRLKALGHLRGPAEGRLTPGLRSAIESFEVQMGRAPAGLASRAILTAADAQAEANQSAVLPAFARTKPLMRASGAAARTR